MQIFEHVTNTLLIYQHWNPTFHLGNTKCML